MGQLTTDSEDLNIELRLGRAQIGAQMKALLQTLTESTSKITTVDQTVKTVRPGASVCCQGTSDEGREGRGGHATARVDHR